VILNDLLYNGEPDTRTGILRLGMQPLKDLKDAIQIFFFKANAIISYTP
jgi:hypothetical protein